MQMTDETSKINISISTTGFTRKSVHEKDKQFKSNGGEIAYYERIRMHCFRK